MNGANGKYIVAQQVPLSREPSSVNQKRLASRVYDNGAPYSTATTAISMVRKTSKRLGSREQKRYDIRIAFGANT